MVNEQLQLGDEEVSITLRRAWDRALRLLASRVNDATFKTHFRHLRPVALAEQKQAGLSSFQITLGVPSAFTREWVEKRHSPLIRSTLEEILDGDVSLKFVLTPKESGAAGGAAATAAVGSLFDVPQPPAARPAPPAPAGPPEATLDFGPDPGPAEPPAGAQEPPQEPLAVRQGSRPAASFTGRRSRTAEEPQGAPADGAPSALLTAPAAAPKAAPAPAAAVAVPARPSSNGGGTPPRGSGGTGGHPDAPLLNSRYTFDNFVVGPQNRLAHAGALAVAQGPGRVYNPLFLYGPSGLGKTHLMHAIGNAYLAHNPHAANRIAYISGEAFTSLFVASVREHKGDEFQRRWRSVDLWLVDDIQFIAGKDKTKEEFFHTFNALYQGGKQIVICSDRSPRELRTMDERLRSRFESGLIADIVPPDLETRLAILHKKADQEGMRIPDDVLLYMARLVQSNIRTLEGALVKLVAYASLVNSPVTTDLAASILERYYISAGAGLGAASAAPEEGAGSGNSAAAAATFGAYAAAARGAAGAGMGGRARSGGYGASPSGDPALTADLVQRVVAKRFGMAPEALTGKRRDRDVAHARQIAMHLMRELTEMSLPGIGQLFGGRDHSTVSHACDRVRSQIPQDDDLRSLVEDLAMQIRAQQQAAG